MAGAARGGKTNRPGLDRLGDMGRHSLQVILAGLLIERALAHDIGAQGGMANIAGIVDSLGKGIQHIKVLREGLPLPLDTL